MCRQSANNTHCTVAPSSTPTQEARTAVATKAKEELAEAERRFLEERDRLLEEAEAAAAIAASQIQTIEELRALEAGTRREFEKARQGQMLREGGGGSVKARGEKTIAFLRFLFAGCRGGTHE